MKFFPRMFTLLPVLVCFLFVGPARAVPGGDDWRAIDPAELALKASTVEKDADAEALFWEVRVDDGPVGELVFTNYVRVKVFTERGKEANSRIDLTYFSGSKIKDIAARTIKSDGSIVELKSADVYERTIVKTSGLKLKAKSFAVPGIEPGAIIEYRWRDVRSNASANYVELHFQRDIPVRSITYLIRPYTGPYASGMRYHPFQMPAQVKFEKAKNGFFSASLSNVPAYREEPRMPPEDSVRSWVLLYYTDDTSTTNEKYWKDFGKRLNDAIKDEMKANDDVKRAAAQVVGDAATPDEKLKRIYEYCQTKIKNAYSASSGLSNEEREKFKSNKSPAETLKKGIGSSNNIDQLFAALAIAAGFEAHAAFSANREEIFFSRDFANPYFLINRGTSFIAVRDGEFWRFFSPAESYTPFGMLGWREEGQQALIIDKEPVWVETPISKPEQSLAKRTGKFRLLEDGTLEGDVTIEYSGQLAIDRKYDNDNDSPAEREKTLTDAVKERMSSAELSDIKVENVLDPIKPFVYSYHVRVPGYAQRTGRRLFLQPGFFMHGLGPLFSASERKNAIVFQYPWSEEDHITIELPAGFVLDNADAPVPVTPEMTQGICQHKIKMGVTQDRRTLDYRRSFFFGAKSSILYPATSYSALKQLFDLIHKADDHTITLKQSASSSD